MYSSQQHYQCCSDYWYISKAMESCGGNADKADQDTDTIQGYASNQPAIPPRQGNWKGYGATRSELPTLPYQFAYTPLLGITDAVFKFATDIIAALDNRDTVGLRALLLDFSKAFGKMQPHIAIAKMLKLKINPTIISLIRSFLSDRSKYVKYQTYKSAHLPSHIRIPQGTIFIPILWNIYVNDLTPETSFIKHADNSTLYSVLSKSETKATHSTPRSVTLSIPSDNKLQQAANYAVDWCDTNKMILSMLLNGTPSFSPHRKLRQAHRR